MRKTGGEKKVFIIRVMGTTNHIKGRWWRTRGRKEKAGEREQEEKIKKMRCAEAEAFPVLIISVVLWEAPFFSFNFLLSVLAATLPRCITWYVQKKLVLHETKESVKLTCTLLADVIVETVCWQAIITIMIIMMTIIIMTVGKRRTKDVQRRK